VEEIGRVVGLFDRLQPWMVGNHVRGDLSADLRVVLPFGDHRGGRLTAHGDPALLRGTVGNRGQRIVVLCLQPHLLSWEQRVQAHGKAAVATAAFVDSVPLAAAGCGRHSGRRVEKLMNR
jgi:hypothetical protein